MYGVGDQPPYAGEDENMRMLMLKDEQIDQLKQEITHLKINRGVSCSDFGSLK